MPFFFNFIRYIENHSKKKKDFNECNGENGGYSCGQYKQCVNTPGSYRCDCMAGFQTQGNNCLGFNLFFFFSFSFYFVLFHNNIKKKRL